ncbi:alpha-galactosidase [Clavibacter sp. B3I6]|uniref:glycoside hydrolase family 36 protein n=1 Tax=Clavibacter sp. B3I6 TaxID=3042268 RepID=UPI002787ACA8|nr:glycoside hydrolase family 36 protein [Clavibacter sp. B3I6]MDQ0744131.1 alpha-galactosidase [Clavibacter sp. B3I6]
MTVIDTPLTTSIQWDGGGLLLTFEHDPDGPVRLVAMGGAGAGTAADPESSTERTSPRQPLVEVLSPAWGRLNNSYRYDGTALGAGLRFVSSTPSSTDGVDRLEIVQRHEGSGLVATTVLEAHAGVAAVRTTTTIRVEAARAPLPIWAVTSFATGAVVSDSPNDVDLWWADSGWCSENRWTSRPLRSPGLVAIDRTARGETSRNRLAISSSSTWSSGVANPAGAARDRRTGRTLAWQVEHNGAWAFELGEDPDWGHGGVPLEDRLFSDTPFGPPRADRSRDGAYVAVLGPTDTLHQWSVVLDGTTSFTTVPVSFTAAGSLEDAFGRLAEQRRASRRRHTAGDALPVVFNDYMNTLEGDPTEGKLLPLIDAAARVGAEVFCIDAGWYDDTAGWWASVGDWMPSTARFPSGLPSVLDHIRSRGMVAGLWLEPEVVGVTSEAARTLPDSAFLQRGGVRVVENARYLLDLRSPAARAHLDEAVDRLVGDLGVGFFKLDYNVTPGAGTDLDASSVGAGLLDHNRALLAWLSDVLDRHPDLILENCGSGAMRSDAAMLRVLQLQSTSDQQDPLLYPMIAVGALAHILPEQAGNWAYPQPDMTDEMVVFTECTGLAGRLYQAGVLSGMDDHGLDLVADAVRVHKETRHALASSTPRFPTGLPSWDDAWTSVAFDVADSPDTYVVAWRQAHAGPVVQLALPHLGDGDVDVEQVYPPAGIGAEWTSTRTAEGMSLDSGSGTGIAGARMYRVRRA